MITSENQQNLLALFNQLQSQLKESIAKEAWAEKMIQQGFPPLPDLND